jgi:PAS domain S-box-containing protein
VTGQPPIAATALETMLGALPVPAYTNDLNGFVTWQNAAAHAIAGDRVGIHYSEAVPPEELQRSRETWAAVTLSGATRRRNARFKNASGELVHLQVITSPVKQDGRVVGVFGIAIPLDDRTGHFVAELSPRQEDVLRLLLQAKTTGEIAAELHLATETVRNHIRNLLKALGAQSRLEAALIALREGLIELDVDSPRSPVARTPGERPRAAERRAREGAGRAGTRESR